MGVSIYFTYKTDTEYKDESGIKYRRSYVIANEFDMYEKDMTEFLIKKCKVMMFPNASSYLSIRTLEEVKSKMKNQFDIEFIEKLIELSKDNCVYVTYSV